MAQATAQPGASAPDATAYSSAKQLWHLVTEQSLVTSDDVLSRELARHRPFLAEGLAWFGKGVKTPTTTPAAAAKRPQGKLSRFVGRLAELLGMDDDVRAKGILSAYLAGDFRGTKQSLRKMVDDERLQRPLMVDVWQYYRAERLYLLQVLKELLSYASNPSHPHHDQFSSTVSSLDGDDGLLGKSLLKQLRTAVTEKVPSRETHGPAFGEQCLRSWVHFNLREQSELLQINLIYLHSCPAARCDLKTLKTYLEVFQDHAFGQKQSTIHVAEVNEDLVESIGKLEALILVYLIDLPSLTAKSDDHPLLRSNSSEDAAKTDRIIAGLGSYSEHGPVMLGWMLARCLSDNDGTALIKYQSLGERSVHLRSLSFLTRTVCNGVISSHSNVLGVARGICYAVLAVLASAFDLQQMGLANDALELMLEVIKADTIAKDFWKQGFEVGLGTSFATLLSSFPFNIQPFCRACRSLSAAGADSAENVLHCLQGMPVFAELIGEVRPGSVSKFAASDGGEKWQLRAPRQLAPDTDPGFAIPAGTAGVVECGSNVVRWQCRFNAFRFFFAEIDALTKQISLGANHVNKETLMNVTHITSLLETLMKNSNETARTIEQLISRSIFPLVDRASHLAQPPLKLLANCLGILSVVAKVRPRHVWGKLAECGLFPTFVRKTMLASSTRGLAEDDLSPGLVGSLLAQQECVNGEYPLTTAFLNLLLSCAKSDDGSLGDGTSASVVYVARDIFPSYRQWRFVDPVEKEAFGQKMLLLFKTFLGDREAAAGSTRMKSTLCDCLTQPAPLNALLLLVGTGDRTIRCLLEAQSSWEIGVGVELTRSVDLAAVVFERLLVCSSDIPALTPRLEDISRLLCSPAMSGQGGQQHFILVLAHYIYHAHTCGLPVSAMRLLGTIARMFPMSLLACLGSEAEAVRDILIYRLDSQTEDVALKVGIVDLFSACVDSQPGFIQLLIGIKQDVQLVVGDKPVSKEEETKNKSVQLVSEQGCLRLILDLMEDTTAGAQKRMEELHLSLANFLLNLWQHQRILAMSHLKKQPIFWERLTWSLFDKNATGRLSINSRIFRILANEIYTFGGQVDKPLLKVLEKLTDEKENHLVEWNKRVLSKVKETPAMEIEDTIVVVKCNKDDYVSLLSAWKAFLAVLSRDQPVSVSPQQCHQIASGIVAVIETQLTGSSSADPTKDARIVTSLAEFCLVLMRRWQTKCAGTDMRQWMERIGSLLRAFSSPACQWDRLPSRARAAVLGVCATALRASSHFKLEGEAEVLVAWLDSAAVAVQRVFTETQAPDGDGLQEDQFAIMSVDLLRNLVNRIREPSEWYPAFHYHVLMQALLSRLNWCLTAQRQPDLCQAILGLLCLVAREKQGLDALLSSNLSQLVWLPLSDVGKKSSAGGSQDWTRVFRLALNLANYLQTHGGHLALQSTLDVLVLLQDRLTAYITLPKALLGGVDEIRLMVESVDLAAHCIKHYKQWQLLHPASLTHYYQILCANLYHATCLLLRPATMSQMITSRQSKNGGAGGPQQTPASVDRVRRVSSTEQELEAANTGVAPEVALAQTSLLEAAGAVIGALLALSPKLEDLAGGSGLHDPEEYQQLLGIGFTSPSFEQEGGLSYGTLISLANFCIRTLSKMGGGGVGGSGTLSEGGNRTPSPITPSKSPAAGTAGFSSSSPTPGSTSSRLAPPASSSLIPASSGLERKRLVLVLERSMTLMLAQSMLFFTDPSYSTRDKQFLRRELGAEFSSFSESIRRYISGSYHHRGGSRIENTPSPQSGGPRSPGGVSQASSSARSASGASKSEEQFMKAISSVVQVVFK